ncbi:hypothetical protein V8F33_010665 [Rhypophila sp. PSN 637]
MDAQEEVKISPTVAEMPEAPYAVDRGLPALENDLQVTPFSGGSIPDQTPALAPPRPESPFRVPDGAVVIDLTTLDNDNDNATTLVAVKLEDSRGGGDQVDDSEEDWEDILILGQDGQYHPLRPPPGPPPPSPWANENRPNIITLVQEDEGDAIVSARNATDTADVIDGVLQLVFFCDASRLAVKRPFAKTNESRHIQESAVFDVLFSIQQGELTGISQCLQSAGTLVDMYPDMRYKIIIFTDSSNGLDRLREGTNMDMYAYDAEGRGANSWARKFYGFHTLPVVKAIIWQSYGLQERGADIEFHWMPRRKTEPARMADNLAKSWSKMTEEFWVREFHDVARTMMPALLREDVLDAVGPFMPGGTTISILSERIAELRRVGHQSKRDRHDRKKQERQRRLQENTGTS